MDASGERVVMLRPEPSAAPSSSPTPVAPAPVRRSREMLPWYLLFALLIVLVAGGAWWLGTRQRSAPPPQLPVETPNEALPPVPATTEEMAVETPAADLPAPVVADQPLPPALQRTPDVARRNFEVSRARSRSASVERSRRVFPAEDVGSEPLPETGPEPVVVYHPQRDRGRVVQLGAFPTRDQAETAWRRVVRRYPYLKTRSKMVNAVDVGMFGDTGRPTRMYRLQLGTSSQAQSVVICQRLEMAGQSCVVVY